ncbi:MAG: hypothetical protein GXO85_16385 [Chlorobi bacterium]|nr:hypothetical protein [Chlorobiota bacterium]
MKLINSITFVILLITIPSTKLFSQTLSNLERINLLVDQSTKEISSALKDTTNSYLVENNTPSEYSVLNDRVISDLSKKGIKIDNNSTMSNKISYTISYAGVEYPDLFKDGIFGGYLLERKFNLMGNYIVEKEGVVISSNTFEISNVDTISYDKYSFIENNSLPFTKANVPSKPFLPSIIEPVIAITAVAVTIILFFTVRSK